MQKIISRFPPRGKHRPSDTHYFSPKAGSAKYNFILTKQARYDNTSFEQLFNRKEIAVTKEMPQCSFQYVHEDTVKEVKTAMPEEEKLYDVAELFKMFSDSTRIRILYVLLTAEVCVCDLAALLSMTDSAVSHQLRILKQARLVKYRRSGKTVFYSLADAHVRSILCQGMEHIEE